MSAESWQRALEIVALIEDQEPDARERIIATECGGDSALESKVRELLAELQAIDQKTKNGAPDLLMPVRPGEILGPYQILKVLGSGGMGIVYLATRVEADFNREVAIKVLQIGQANADAERRFIQEMGILAKLNHANIAKLHEGGRADNDRLYYIMEYVEGQSIDVYCREKGLSLEKRLRLFQKVCAAVQYAHRNLIVHRDLKPSNILVSGEGEPKLLDFGIAKLIGNVDKISPGLTGGYISRFTPDYASPEQLNNENITTASDVYSLGIILYELATGDRAQSNKSSSDHDESQAVHKSILAYPGKFSAGSVPQGGGDPAVQELKHCLQGDLDTIISKALRVDPEERYLSPENLSEDIQRYITGFPILARKRTWVYRSKKFLYRNRWTSAIAALLLLLFLGLSVLLLLQYQSTLRERNKFEAVATFLIDLFRASDPSNAEGAKLTAEEILDRGAARVTARPPSDQLVHGAISHTIGVVYLKLGIYERAQFFLESALTLRKNGSENDRVETLLNLAWVYRIRNELDKAESSIRKALYLEQSLSSARSLRQATILDTLGSIQHVRGKYEQAESYHREALAIHEGISKSATQDKATFLHNLGLALREQGDYKHAEPYLREALDILRSILGPDDPDVTRCTRSLGWLLFLRGDYDSAEELLRKAVEQSRHQLGESHSEVATNTAHLAHVLYANGAFSEAAMLFTSVTNIYRISLGDEHPNVARSEISIGDILRDRGEYDEAERLYKHAIESLKSTLGESHPQVAVALTHIGNLMRDREESLRAKDIFEEALAISKKSLGAQHPWTITILLNLAIVSGELGNYEAAEQIFQEVIDFRKDYLGLRRHEVGVAIGFLSAMYLQKGDYERALDASTDAAAIFDEQLSPTHWLQANIENIIGAALAGLGRFDEAEPRLLESLDRLKDLRGAESRPTREAMRRVEWFYDMRKNRAIQ